MGPACQNQRFELGLQDLRKDFAKKAKSFLVGGYSYFLTEIHKH